MANLWRLRRYAAAALIGGGWFVVSGAHRVPAGDLLVVTNVATSERQILGPGLHWVMPSRHVVQMSVNFQLAEQVVRTVTTDGQEVSYTVSAVLRPDLENPSGVLSGTSDLWPEIRLPQALDAAAPLLESKSVSQLFPVSRHNSQLEEFRQQLEAEVRASLREHSIELARLSIDHIQFSDELWLQQLVQAALPAPGEPDSPESRARRARNAIRYWEQAAANYRTLNDAERWMILQRDAEKLTELRGPVLRWLMRADRAPRRLSPAASPQADAEGSSMV